MAYGEPVSEPSLDTVEQEDSGSFYVPDFAGSEALKEGDTITLTVVGRDDNGLQVEPAAKDKEPMDYMDDLTQSVTNR